MVVVSVGGNDVHLTDTMKVCADAWKNNRSCSTDTAVTGPAAERVRTVGAKLAEAVEAVRAAVKDTGSSPRILVQSYPMPLASGKAATTAAHDENGWDRWSAYGCPFYNRDLRWIATGLGAALNREIKKAAVRTGADHVDLGRLLEGHQVCGNQLSRPRSPRTAPSSRRPPPRPNGPAMCHGRRPNSPSTRHRSFCTPTTTASRRSAASDARRRPAGDRRPGADAQCRGAAGKAPEQVGVTFTR
ncbi:hypothetical protein ACFQ6Q_37280 [Streptomyces sp. NPDC056437]|uniref:hypothetical protein n=1 Tax=Streptomyces sp. NPDC056437 TaxID=3345816 RepID=UPI0036CEDEA1